MFSMFDKCATCSNFDGFLIHLVSNLYMLEYERHQRFHLKFPELPLTVCYKHINVAHLNMLDEKHK